MDCRPGPSPLLTRRRLIAAGIGVLLAAACRAVPEPSPEPVSTAPGVVIGDPGIAPLVVAAPGSSELARPVLVEFTRQNPSLLARWEQIEGNYAAAVESRLGAGSGPDLARVREGHLGRWRHAEVIRPFAGEDLVDQIPSLLFGGARAATFGPDGQLWGIPHYHDAMFLAYNQAHLDKLGGKAPETLEQMAAFAREIQSRQSLRNPISINLAPKVHANLPWWGLLKAAGGAIDGSDAHIANAITVLQTLKSMAVDDGTLDPGIERPDYIRLAEGDCAFAVVGAYAGPQLRQFGLPIEFAPLPGIAGPGRGSVSWTPLFALVNNPEPHPAAALLAAHLGLVDKSGSLWGPRHFALAGGLPPAYPSLLEDGEIRASFAQWVDPATLATVFESAEPVEFLWEPWFQPWEHRCQDAMMSAVVGQSDAAGAIASMRPEVR